MRKLPELFRLAWRNMWRNWRRTAIALTAIVTGVVVLIFAVGLIYGSDQTIFGNAVRFYGGNIQVHAPGYREKARRLPLVPLADAAAVVAAARERPEVVSAARRIVTGGMVTGREGSHPVVITAVEPGVEGDTSIVAENVGAGRYLDPADESAIYIGQGLADKLGVAVGDRVSLLGRARNESMRQHSMTIVGIYDLGVPDAETTMVYIPLGRAQTLYKLPDQATEVALTLQRVGQEEAVMAALAEALPGYDLDSWETLRPELRETLDTKGTFSSIFGMVVILIACIGILNLMLMAVFERTREMGVLAALGMKGRDIMALFLVEGTLIGALGATIGCLLGVLLVWLVAQVGFDISSYSGMGEISALMGTHIYPAVTAGQVLSRGLAVTLIAMLASLYPAWLAARREPAEVLHHV